MYVSTPEWLMYIINNYFYKWNSKTSIKNHFKLGHAYFP